MESDAPDDVEISQEGSSTVIRIGDEDVEISGRHTYTIAYRVEGALNAFADHDELFWNAIGHEWEASIVSADVTVRAPGRVQRVACFQGSQGSTEPCALAEFDGSEARFSPGGSFVPYEGMTVVVAIPKGSVPEPAADPRGAVGGGARLQREPGHGHGVARRAGPPRRRALPHVVSGGSRSSLPRLSDRPGHGVADRRGRGGPLRGGRCGGARRVRSSRGHPARADRHPDRRTRQRDRRHRDDRRSRGPRVPADPGDPGPRVVLEGRLEPHPPGEGRDRVAPVREAAARRSLPGRQRGQGLGAQDDVRRTAAWRRGVPVRGCDGGEVVPRTTRSGPDDGGRGEAHCSWSRAAS